MHYKTIIPTILLVSMLAGGRPATLFALTAQEMLALKKAGVGDETIRMMMQQEEDGKKQTSGNAMGKREIRDSQGDVSIEYSTGRNAPSAGADTQQQQVDKAWEMLRHLIVDTRKTN
ncbi:MAG: hypothetical protein V1766_15470 [Pseudomonadota bacterium]